MIKRFLAWLSRNFIEITVCVVVVTVILLVITLTVHSDLSSFWWSSKQAQLEECLASEIYTREECIILAGGQK